MITYEVSKYKNFFRSNPPVLPFDYWVEQNPEEDVEQDPEINLEQNCEQDPDMIYGRLIWSRQNKKKKNGGKRKEVNSTVKAIVVDCQRDLLNGLIDVNRDVLMKLIRIVKDDKKTRNIMGMSQTFYMWSKLRIFRWAAKDIQKPLRPRPRLPHSAFRSSKELKIKVVIVGDGDVGKTCLLLSHAKNEFPSEYIPAVYSGYMGRYVFEGRVIFAAVEDTAGQNEFDLIRPLVYPGTDVLLVCCSVADRSSLLHVATKWIPEIKKHTKNIPMVLVSTKSDLRVGSRHSESLFSPAEAKAVARTLGMADYIECSAKLRRNVEMVFRAAFYYAFLKNVKRRISFFDDLNVTPKVSSSGCIVL